MRNMTPENMARVTAGELLGPETLYQTEITDVVTDSRKIQSGCLFAAIRGERADGHTFIAQTIRDGADQIFAGTLETVSWFGRSESGDPGSFRGTGSTEGDCRPGRSV